MGGKRDCINFLLDELKDARALAEQEHEQCLALQDLLVDVMTAVDEVVDHIQPPDFVPVEAQNLQPGWIVAYGVKYEHGEPLRVASVQEIAFSLGPFGRMQVEIRLRGIKGLGVPAPETTIIVSDGSRRFIVLRKPEVAE